jgi:hypothetical protein
MTLPKTPIIPKGYDWTVDYHNNITEIPKLMKLHLEPEQEKGYLRGEVLAKCLKEKALNGNHLDYLLKHTELIPDEWKANWVYFWGTIYRNAGGGIFVRCLDWDGDRWNWNYGWFDDDWDGDDPAAVSASPLNSDTQPSATKEPTLALINAKLDTLLRNFGLERFVK